MQPVSLPSVFAPETEAEPFLIQMRRRASKEFRWTRSRSLEDAMHLAYWDMIFDKADEALEVCRFITQYQFAGNHSLWTWVESCLSLQARLTKPGVEAEECIRRILSAGFVQTRLEGTLLTGHERNVNLAVADGSRLRERNWRAVMVTEQITVIELGGSPEQPVSLLEEKLTENLRRLRELTGASKPPPGANT